ncbi:hypothetical protein BDV95DRAFT_497216 [Massariosphaeria phaeospora]|uniref:Uncharacterized protein n=1 Tax=Massariosphaeria phaeospora TaxID=100035 RepID=A0A7C8M768_9PLEO|nr:hypothetical protein BDV95DRAFT_497216 [Massariosphaeria phaeospora]
MASQSKLESLPPEIVNHILSYLVHPRSRLAGLTELQSTHDFPYPAKQQARDKYHFDHTAPPDADRFGADTLTCARISHPFYTLALTSRRCRRLIESYCAHLVKAYNRFNLPFAHLETYGAQSVYPNLTAIVYRRLWLQFAPRLCIYCGFCLSCYPHKKPFPARTVPPIATCPDCFYAQILLLNEVEHQYHFSPEDLAAHNVRGTDGYEWALRIDVEDLALMIYHTRAFHSLRSRKGPCPTCTCAGIDASLIDKTPHYGTLPKRSRRTP